VIFIRRVPLNNLKESLVGLPVLCVHGMRIKNGLKNKLELVMKKMKFALLSSLAAVSLTVMATSPSFAQDLERGTYFSLGLGANFPGKSSVDFRAPGVASGAAVNGNTKFDTGYIMSGALGYRWSPMMRGEVEVNMRRASVDSIGELGAPGKQRVFGVMGNVLFDVTEIGAFRPYVGGGAGVGWNKWTNVSARPQPTFPAGTTTFTDKDTGFQWQAIGGASFPFTGRTDGFVEYRYIGLERGKFYGAAAGTTASRHSDRSHNLLAGVRINF